MLMEGEERDWGRFSGDSDFGQTEFGWWEINDRGD